MAVLSVQVVAAPVVEQTLLPSMAELGATVVPVAVEEAGAVLVLSPAVLVA